MTKPKPAGIILAAGESSRMGADKALLSYGGSTFLEHLIGLFLPRVEPVVVVLGHHADEIRAAVGPRPGLEIIVNTQYQAGQLSSLQAGLRALPAAAPAALLTLVDHPAVAAATLDAMLERFTAAASALLIPRYRARRGHPVLLGRALLEEILALPVSASAKQVIHAHLGEAVFLDVDDPGVAQDIDTPADYGSLVERRGGA
ncbi:MAG TPA: nucleotidyltransferase family protein [Bryobacterales bacterium]|nr:nucleotidyltransferase family protein [Bryobacterales bacterium]